MWRRDLFVNLIQIRWNSLCHDYWQKCYGTKLSCFFAERVVDHRNISEDEIDQTSQCRQSQISRLSLQCGDWDYRLLYAVYGEPVIVTLRRVNSIWDGTPRAELRRKPWLSLYRERPGQGRADALHQVAPVQVRHHRHHEVRGGLN